MKLEKYFLSIIKIGIYLILLTPLVLAPVGLTLSAFPKAVFFRSLVEIIFIFYLLLLVLNRKYLPKFSPITWAVLAFVSVLLLTSITGVNPFRSFFGDAERAGGVILYIHFLIFFLIISGIGLSKKDWFNIFKTAVGVSGLVSFAAVLQKLGVWNFYGVSLPNRVSGTLSNPDFFGPYAVLSIFLTVFVLLIEKKKDLRITWFGILGLHLLGLVLSRTRGAWVAFGMALTFSFFIWFFKYSVSHVWRKRIIFLALFLSLLLFFLVVNKESIDNSLLKRALSVFDFSFGSRGDVWEIAFQAWKEKPVLGWGPESFSYLFSKYFKADYLSEIPEGMYFDYAHNKVFNLMAATGLMGLFSWLFVLGTAFYFLVKKTFIRKEFSLIFSGFLVAYFFQSLSVFDTISIYLLLFLALAFISRFYAQERGVRVGKKAIVVLAPILIVASLASFYYLNARSVIAASYFPKYFFYEKENPMEAVEGYKRGAEKGVIFRKDFEIVTVERGLILIEDKRTKQKEITSLISSLTPVLEKYLENQDRRYHNVYGFLARTYENNYLYYGKDLEKMESVLKKAIGFNNQRPEFFRLMGELELIKGNAEKADHYFKKSSSLRPDPFLEKTYYYRDWGKALVKLERYEEAASYLEKAINRLYILRKVKQEDLKFFEFTGQFFCKDLKNRNKCEDVFEKMEEIAPRYRGLIQRKFEFLEREYLEK